MLTVMEVEGHRSYWGEGGSCSLADSPVVYH